MKASANETCCELHATIAIYADMLHDTSLMSVHISDVRILKFLVRVYPRTSTKDPRPRLCPQADAVSDPLSVRESAARLLTHQQLCAAW